MQKEKREKRRTEAPMDIDRGEDGSPTTYSHSTPSSMSSSFSASFSASSKSSSSLPFADFVQARTSFALAGSRGSSFLLSQREVEIRGEEGLVEERRREEFRRSDLPSNGHQLEELEKEKEKGKMEDEQLDDDRKQWIEEKSPRFEQRELEPPKSYFANQQSTSKPSPLTQSWKFPDPYTVAGYIQLVYNFSILIIAAIVVFHIYQAVYRDVELKALEYSAQIEKEIEICQKAFLDNKCGRKDRIPSVEEKCISWQQCLARDPKELGWAKISAETVAEILNGFVEPISFKTMAFLFGLVVVIPLCFFLFRCASRSSHSPQSPPVHPPFNPYATPFQPLHPPFQTHYPSYPPFQISQTPLPPRSQLLEYNQPH